MKQEDHKFKASLNYARRSCFNRKDDDKPRKEGCIAWRKNKQGNLQEKRARNHPGCGKGEHPGTVRVPSEHSEV